MESRGRPPKKVQKVTRRTKKAAVPVAFSVPAEDFSELTASHGLAFAFPARLCAFLLLLVLLLQPFASVFASEGTEPGAETSPASEPEMAFSEKVEIAPREVASVEMTVEDGPQDSAEEPVATEVADVAVVNESEVAGTSAAIEEEVVAEPPAEVVLIEDVVTVDDTSPASDVEVVSSFGGGANTDVVASTTPDAEVLGTSTVADVAVSEPVEAETIEEVAVPAPEVPSEDSAEEIVATSSVATTTEEVTVIQPEMSGLVNDNNRYQFGVNECVTVADGFFYCTKASELTLTGNDRFYSAQDSDGDFEIFLEKDGESTQITHNLNDDSAPFYDPASETLVWHALISDRYQIMRFSLKDSEMTQLTNDQFNNMEPVISGDRIVWQAWVENDWEIMMDEGGERTQLTNNDLYDIDPHVRDDLVSWQTRNGDSWHVEVYDIGTGHVEIMEAGDGASVENPRFVLLYDSKKANGDTETVGYDLVRKKVITLGTTPESVPNDIPEPEHEKEERALVQTVPNVKEETSGEDGIASSTPTIEPPVSDDELVASSSVPEIVASSTEVVVAPDVATDATTPVVATSSEFIETAVPTLDLRPAPAELSPIETAIPDLVITPLPPQADEEAHTLQ